MNTVKAWLGALHLEHFAAAFEHKHFTSMLLVSKMTPEQLASLGLKEEEVSRALASLEHIRALTQPVDHIEIPVTSKAEGRSLHPKILAVLLKLMGGDDGETLRRLTVDKVEQVGRSELKRRFEEYCKQLEGDQMVLRAYLVDPKPDGVILGRSEVAVDVLLREGLQRFRQDGPFGRGVYFPCNVCVDQTVSKSFQAVLCQVAVGKMWEYIRDPSEQATIGIGESGFDSVVVGHTPGGRKEMLRHDLVLKNADQVVPRFLVRFSLHAEVEGSSMFSVAKDGSGDFSTVAAAMSGASDGDRIVIAPGSYMEPLVLTKSLHLVAGVAGEAVLPAIEVKKGRSTLSGLMLSQGVVMQGEETAVSFEDCDVTGSVVGMGSARLELRHCKVHDVPNGCGLRLSDRAQCVMEECEVFDIGQCGVQADGSSNLVIFTSSLFKCQQNGVYALEQAKCMMESCDVYANAFPGIAVSGAESVIKHNRIHHGLRSGIVIASTTAGDTLVEGNNVFGNARDGIMVAKNAVCQIQDNAIYDNKAYGIQVTTGAMPVIHRNKLHNNGEAGVLLGKSVDASVRENDIFGNATGGIMVHKYGTSVIEGNEVFLSGGTAAVLMQKESRPKLLNNRIYDSKGHGLVMERQSAATVENNTIFNFAGVGIKIVSAQPAIFTGNHVYNCEAGGVAITGDGVTEQSIRASNRIVGSVSI